MVHTARTRVKHYLDCKLSLAGLFGEPSARGTGNDKQILFGGSGTGRERSRPDRAASWHLGERKVLVLRASKHDGEEW
jgi:hypothetical protein